MSHLAPPAVPPVPSKLSGRLHVVAAALLWSTCGLFVKAGFFDAWPEDVQGGLLAFWRALFAGLVLVPLVRRPRWNIYLVPLCAVFALMCVTYLTAMVQTTAANAIWLQATSPWWVLLISVALLHERIARREFIPLCFAGLGVGLILVFELLIQPGSVMGVACGLASGLLYGCVAIFMRLLRGHGAAWLVALPHLVTALAILPWVVAVGIWPTPLQLVVLAAFGILQMGLPYVLFIRALRAITAQEAVAIALIEPMLNPFWVWLLGMETPRWWSVAGSVLILAGLVFRYVVWELAYGRATGGFKAAGTRRVP